MASKFRFFHLIRKETKPVPPAASFGWLQRLFEPETATVQSEFDPGSRLSGLKEIGRAHV